LEVTNSQSEIIYYVVGKGREQNGYEKILMPIVGIQPVP
jgi:hypothetical protein